MPIENDPNGNGYEVGDERDGEPVPGSFHVCPPEWIGDGECDAVCNVTRYNYDCSQPRQGQSKRCDCEEGNVEDTVALMPQPDTGPGASCSAGSNIPVLAQHCERVGGRCTGKDGVCHGVIRGKCGPDCFCCVGRSCDERYVGDGICDQECNAADIGDADDCKGTNDDAFSSQDEACPAAWRGDGHCDLECR